MRQLEDRMDLGALLELRPRETGEFCERSLDAEVLVEELEECGPFAPVRKSFCEFLGIGESTLTGWLKAGRVPRTAKVAYVLLVGMTMLQTEVKRLRREGHELKIVQDGETFQVVRFEIDDTGLSVGKIVARDIADARTARVLAASVKAFRMLQETRDVIGEMLERPVNARYIKHLEDLNTRIIKETLAAFEPDKWREAFGPVDDLDIEDLLGDMGKREQASATAQANSAIEDGLASNSPNDDPAAGKQE